MGLGRGGGCGMAISSSDGVQMPAHSSQGLWVRSNLVVADGKGAWAAADAVAGDTSAQLMTCIRTGGSVYVYGALSGLVANVGHVPPRLRLPCCILAAVKCILSSQAEVVWHFSLFSIKTSQCDICKPVHRYCHAGGSESSCRRCFSSCSRKMSDAALTCVHISPDKACLA